MSIRLSKIAKELNVGIATAVDFLEKRGHTISSDPNSKISDEVAELLYNEFSKDKNMKIESNKVTQQRQTKDKKASASNENRESSPKEEEIKTVIPEDQLPKIKQVGKINLDELNNTTKNVAAPKEEEPQTIEPKGESESVETAPVVEEKDDTTVPAINDDEPQNKEENVVSEDSNTEAPQSGDEVFSLGKVELNTNINVIGKIDLSALNQQTRPKKKSKEERKKEREQRRMPGKGDEAQDSKSSMIKTNVPKLNGPKVVGSINLKSDDASDDKRKKRKRIVKERVDIADYSKGNPGEKNANGKPQQNKNDKQQQGGGDKKKQQFKKPVVKPEVSDEAVQKQIKETLARLTGKGQKTTSSKHRRDKRELQSMKQQELEEQERQNQSKLKITEFVTVSELATMMDVPVTKVIGTCMSLGLMVSINQRLDAETINIVAEEFGFETEYISAEVAEAIHEEEDSEEDLVRRPPIVTVMGHVDHGKTSLLDYIRKTNVIAGEAGGITQHIGAYNVTLSDGQQITFLDTPGHEAFTAMRARGAKVTDIAIIIVAADDDVMPQTVEAINHASVAGVPIVFAINKIDKPTANPDKIKESLANMNYLVEEWGGKYQSQDIAAKKGTGVKELMEKVLLEAEMLDLKANPDRRATGSIIESQLDKGRGYVSTVLVSNGTLKVGDVVVAGTNHGKIKAMFNERNQRIKEARPSEPALILGLDGAPQAGDNFNVLPTEQEAREVANKRLQLQREQGLRTSRHLTLDEIGRRIALGNFQELNVIVKGDVDGSIEALSDSLLKLSTEQIQVNVIHKAVGQISESDVMLAAASNAIIVGFQVRPSVAARKIAEKEEIDIRLYSIIYDAIEEVKSAMEGMLSPELREEITGSAEVQEVFKITKVGTIAGCMVREGKIKRSNKVRLIRDGIVVYTGDLASLKRFKDDVKEVVSGLDCGLNIQNYNDIQVGDIIEGFEQIEVQRKL
ncbi:MAG: translation initiation factor IF-2 [Paludibacteraceae bacterium]|nr:translation initiation factor IF-2 [Paludibacteraceae bacterium]